VAKKTARGPKFVSYFWPVIEVLKRLGGSARPSEVREELVRTLSISEEAQEDTLPSGFPRFDNQVAWARFYLAKAGIIDSSARGVWTLTEKGRALARMTHSEALELFRAVHKEFHAEREHERVAVVEEGDMIPPQDVELSTSDNYRQQLLDILQSLAPSGFERFCQRLLRESGFQEVTVTGRSGDGGIDGLGILQVSPLVSFKSSFPM